MQSDSVKTLSRYPGAKGDGIHTFYPDSPSVRRKRGVGIMEVMVAALLLGILYAAVSNLQKGNRDALLRIRGRDGATEVAQNVIDDLSTRGIAYFTEDNLFPNGDGTWSLAKLGGEDGKTKVKDIMKIDRTWKGQPGLTPNTMTVTYTVEVKVSPDQEYRSKEGSLLLVPEGETCDHDESVCFTHVFAKRLDVKVSWPFKNSTQSISVSGVIR